MAISKKAAAPVKPVELTVSSPRVAIDLGDCAVIGVGDYEALSKVIDDHFPDAERYFGHAADPETYTKLGTEKLHRIAKGLNLPTNKEDGAIASAIIGLVLRMQPDLNDPVAETGQAVTLPPAATIPALKSTKKSKEADMAVSKKEKAAPAAPVKTPAKAKAAPVAKEKKAAAAKPAAKEKVTPIRSAKVPTTTREPAVVQNGVRRPGAKGACGQVWAIADALHAKGKPFTSADIIAHKNAADMNPNNIRCEYSAWCKFMGITPIRTKKTA